MDGASYKYLFGADEAVAADLADAAGAEAVLLAVFMRSDHVMLTLDANGGSLRTDVAASELFPTSYVLPADDASLTGVRLPGAEAFAPGAVAGGDGIDVPSFGDAGAEKALPFTREGYLFAGWKWTAVDATTETEAALDWGGADGDVRVGSGTWNVDLPKIADANGVVSIKATAQWTAAPYVVKYVSEGKTVIERECAYGGQPLPMPDMSAVENQGMSILSWGVSADGSGATWAPGATVTLKEAVSAAATAGEPAASVAGVTSTSGYFNAGPDGKEAKKEGADTVREVRLYATWDAQISAAVPTRLVLLFDPSANNGVGGFDSVEDRISSTTHRPLKVASFRAEWDGSQGAPLRAFWPNSRMVSDSVLSTARLVVTDLGAHVEAAMDAKALAGGVFGDQMVETTEKLTGTVSVSAAAAAGNVAAGFKIPAAQGLDPAVLDLSCTVRIDPRAGFGNPATTLPERPQPLCGLVYTIALDS
jgi:hypothetical protein